MLSKSYDLSPASFEHSKVYFLIIRAMAFLKLAASEKTYLEVQSG